MPAVIEDNRMGGKSVFVRSEADLATVPASHLALLGREERAALSDPARYLQQLARKARRLVHRLWLQALAECDNWVLELHSAAVAGVEPAAYFRFPGHDYGGQGVRLRSRDVPIPLPAPLAEVYELIDSTNHFGYGTPGGLEPARSIVPLKETGVWLSEANIVDPSTCWVFYSLRGGERLCYQRLGHVLWYIPALGVFWDAGSLRTMLDQYFWGLLHGRLRVPNVSPATVEGDNVMGGQTVLVRSDTNLASIPASHLGLLGPEERLALIDHARYFRQLADKAKRPALKQLLQMFAECKEWALELHTATLPGVEGAAYFRFELLHWLSIGVRLQSKRLSKPLPHPLAEVYELINGTNHIGYGKAGGMESEKWIEPIDPEDLWGSKQPAVEAANCWSFYTTPCGDRLCFQPPDRAMWFLHECGTFQEAGSLNDILDEYFLGLIEGDIVLEAPYE